MITVHPEAPQVTLLSQPSCGPCTAAAAHMDREGIPYVKINIREDANAADRIRELGYGGTPVTIVGDMHWHGYRGDKIKQAAKILEAWEPA